MKTTAQRLYEAHCKAVGGHHAPWGHLDEQTEKKLWQKMAEALDDDGPSGGDPPKPPPEPVDS